jgi:YidC/Oxa1 family membrane protein insertase
VIGATPLSPIFRTFLDGIGQVLAFLYNLIPNYGVVIILLTLLIRIVLLPLGIKQIRSMQSMQTVQPELKKIQAKYKGRKDVQSRQKMQEETMRLYKEHGANPFSGCLPMLLQIPVLITLFAVLQFPKGMTHIPHSSANPVVGQPQDSRLYVDIANQRTRFLGINLLCSATQAGTTVQVDPKSQGVPDAPKNLDCGKGALVRIPFYLLLALMIGTTYYQQRQMQRASPAQNQQQQMITRIMPVFFGFIGIRFPASLVIYWTTTNLVQIAQQHFMLPKSPPARPASGSKSGSARPGRPARSGDGQSRRVVEDGPRQPRQGAGGTPGPRAKDQEDRAQGAPGSGRTPGSKTGKSGSGGGRSGGDRKKRRKR